jgi:alcohol dehydrogenase
MKALRLVESGRLVVEQVPEPTAPGVGEALVRIECATLNHLDLYGYRGMAFANRTLPITVGVEAAGVVEAVGAGVDGFGVGSRVAIFPIEPCGLCPACRLGRDTLCERQNPIMGFHADGMATERVRVKARQLVPVPDTVSIENAACVPVTLSTVQRMLFENARLGPGETVLVHAAGSGIGSVAIRMAKAAGATVITTVGSDWKIERALALGADHVINYKTQSFPGVVRRLTGKRGVDVVFEHTGAATWEGSLLSLAKGGRLVTCGSTSGAAASLDLLQLVNRQINIFASFGGSRRDMLMSLQKMESGSVLPVIDSVITLEAMADGLSRMARREVFGKLLLRGFASNGSVEPS